MRTYFKLSSRLGSRDPGAREGRLMIPTTLGKLNIRARIPARATTSLGRDDNKSVVKKINYLFLFFFIPLLLTSCSTITKEAAQTFSAHLQMQDYPAARANNPVLTDTQPTTDLSQYQSVQNRPHQRSDIAIAVAASGGGYRAANLTAGVLMGLEQITNPHLQGNLLEEVDYFSTVSGGGFGVGYYMASLKDFMQTHSASGPFAPQFSFTNTMNNIPDENPLDKDYTDKLFFSADGGQQLEEDLAKSILHTKTGTLTLGDIFIPKNKDPHSVELPYWVTNSTIYQNAALMPFTPDILEKYGVTAYPYNHQMIPVKNYSDIPVAVGLAASASFPFALDPTTLESKACISQHRCYLQLLDGGISDNLGVYTAMNLLKQDAAKTKILIVIDAYAGQDQPFSANAAPPSGGTLFWRIMGIGVDASRQLVKHNINSIARAELCSEGAKNVLVIYLDLENYARARAVKTNLFIPRTQQKLLLQVGQSLVADNPQFSQLFNLLNGNVTVGRCQRSRP